MLSTRPHVQSKESRPPTRPPTCAPPPPSQAGPCADTPSDCACDERYLTATHIADAPQQRDSRARPWRQERQDDVCVRCDTEGTWSRRRPPAVRSHATMIDLLRRREKKKRVQEQAKKSVEDDRGYAACLAGERWRALTSSSLMVMYIGCGASSMREASSSASLCVTDARNEADIVSRPRNQVKTNFSL
jgi:hypothetical protein